MSGQGTAGELRLVLKQLKIVEEHIDDAHKRLEDKLERKLVELVENLQQGAAPQGVEDALQRWLQKFLPVGEKEGGRPVAAQGGHCMDKNEVMVTSQLPSTWRNRHVDLAIKTGSTEFEGPATLHAVKLGSVLGPFAPSHSERSDGSSVATIAPSLRTTSFMPLPAMSKKEFSHRSNASQEDLTRKTMAMRPRYSLVSEQATSSKSMLTVGSRAPYAVGPYPSSSIFPVHPNGSLVRMYDVFIFALLICEVIVVPYQVAFDVTSSKSTAAAIVTYAALACWTVDLVAGFLIGAYHKGELVLDMRTIAVFYLKREFLLNFITLLLDVCSIVAEAALAASGDGDSSSHSLRLTRLARFLRVCVKLLGLGGTRRALNLSDSIASAVRQQGIGTQVKALIQVCGALFVILLVNHLGACALWLVGNTAVQQYISDYELPPNTRTEYYVAYYNSVSLMIAGENIFTPATTNEILATIVGIYFGLVFVSVIISKVATSLIDFHIGNKENSDKVRQLQKYLRQRRVEAQVAIPVEKQIFERLRSVKWLSEKDVSVLSILSPALRVELLCSVYGGSVRQLPLLAVCCCIDENYIKDICYHALMPEVVDPGYRPFEQGEEAAGAYYLSWGLCEYILGGGMKRMPSAEGGQPGTPVTSTMDTQEVSEGAWISELALWINWRHRGGLECSKACELLHLDSLALLRVLKFRPLLCKITRDYMRAVADAVATEPEDRFTDLNKLVEYETVIASLPLESRCQLSNAVIEQYGGGGGSWVRPFGVFGLKELAGEVAAGACDLIVDTEERVKRVVNVVVLHLTREDGRLLVRIAEKRGTSLTPELMLPGTKVRGGELPARALRRFLDNQLKELGHAVQIDFRKVEIEERMSNTYAVNTRYVRTVFYATFDSGACSTSSVDACRPQPRRLASKTFTQVPSFRNLRSNSPTRLDLLCKNEVIFLDSQTDGHATICAWMDPEEFRVVVDANAAEATARLWLQALQLDLEPPPPPRPSKSEVEEEEAGLDA